MPVLIRVQSDLTSGIISREGLFVPVGEKTVGKVRWGGQ